MANRWCDGFGRYGGNDAYLLNGSSGQAWAEDFGAWTLSTANPRTGTYHMRTANSGILRRVFGAALDEALVGFAVYFDQLPEQEFSPGAVMEGCALASFRDAANIVQLTIALGTDGGLVAYRGGQPGGGGVFGSAVLLDRSAPIIGAGAYQHVEIYAKAGNGTDGALEIRVDEVTKLNLTGIDTISTANVEFSQVAFDVRGNLGYTWDLADVYCNDTTADGSACDTFIGDCKSGWLPVNGDTAQADFVLSTGASGYALLDDIPPDDADYISTGSATAQSNFAVANGPGNLSEILTTRPAIRAMKDDAGTCTVAPSMISNGDKATVSDQPITTAFAYYDSNVPISPDTGVPWTPSEINAALEVVERIS